MGNEEDARGYAHGDQISTLSGWDSDAGIYGKVADGHDGYRTKYGDDPKAQLSLSLVLWVDASLVADVVGDEDGEQHTYHKGDGAYHVGRSNSSVHCF